MPVRHIAFRTDATNQIGTGHFMRCLTLADGLLRGGVKMRFVSRGLPAHLRDMLAQRSIDLASLDSETESVTTGDLQHAHWLGCSQEQDAQATQHALADRQWDWLIVDHYALDAHWESELRGSAKRIMVIDDIADRQHDCDLLLDQNYYPDMQTRYTGKVPAGCEMLLGPRYALLREEFRKLREHTRPRTGPVRKILVFFGGVDAANCTVQAIEALAETDLSGIRVDVVIGAQHPCVEQIQAACAGLGYVCHVQTTRMAELMAASDLAIGAGGATSWERCCLGLPALLVSLAENQVDIAKALDSIGACIYIGTKEVANSLTIRRAITALMGGHAQLAAISGQAFSLVDGMGLDRVCLKLGY
jgi:UDP-2,4-diacetamido-2,4,6-trideoxy-beta-L-altropyranose hydrolase